MKRLHALSVVLTAVACGSSGGDAVPDPGTGTSGGTSGATSGGTSGATSGGTSGTSGATSGGTSGATSGGTSGTSGSDPLPTASGFPKAVDNLGTQLETAKIPWRSYQEGMGTACNLSNKSNPTGNYGPKHDPFLYFTDMQKTTPGLCAKNNVDYGEFAADLAAGTYRYMWITPNLTNDGHDPDPSVGGIPAQTLKTSDDWAKTNIAAIMASPVYLANGVIFLTWDEAEGRSGAGSKEQVPMIVITPKLKGAKMKSVTAYSHKSYLATVEDLLKLPRLPSVMNETAMSEFFK